MFSSISSHYMIYCSGKNGRVDSGKCVNCSNFDLIERLLPKIKIFCWKFVKMLMKVQRVILFLKKPEIKRFSTILMRTQIFKLLSR